MQFSDPLIDNAIRVFQEENGILLTREEANAALEGLAGLFLAFADKQAPKRLEALGAAYAVAENVF